MGSEWTDLVMPAWAQLWQVTLLVVVVGMLSRVLGRNRPHLAYALWLVVLVKCVTPPLLTSASGVFCWLQPVERVVAVEAPVLSDPVVLAAPPDELVIPLYPIESVHAAPAELPPVMETPRFQFSPTDLAVFGLIVWGIGATVSLTLSTWRWQACLRTARRVRGKGDAELADHVQELAQRLGLRRRVRAIVTRGRLGPAVTGVFWPTLLMPEGMLTGKTLDKLDPVLVHELMHIRRGDLWAGLLQTVVLALWWFHPLVRWAVRQAMREAEHCCDEAVLAELGCKPKDYARSLLGVLQYKMEWAPAPAFPGAGRIGGTAKRLERIMRSGQGCRRQSPWWCWLVMLGVATLVLPGGAFVVSAEKESDEPRPPELESVEESPKKAMPQSAATAATESQKTMRLVTVYAIEDTLSEIAQALTSVAEAKTKLMKLCGFDADGKSLRGGDSRVAWQDDRLVAYATRAEHESISAELDAIHEYGLCQLEIEVLCLQGPADEIRAILESEGPLVEPLRKEEQEATDGQLTQLPQLTCKSLVVHQDLEQVLRQSKANPAVRVLASPRLRVETGQTATVRIGGEIPVGPDAAEESAAVRQIPVGLDMRFQPRLRAKNRVLLHSDVTLSELVDLLGGTRLESKGLPLTGAIFSRQASSTTFYPLGETIAIRTQGATGKEGDSEETLFLVRVEKSEAGSPTVKRQPGSLRAWLPLGLQLEPIDGDEFKSQFRTRYRGGLRVTKVRPESPAAKQGIRVGDVLVGLHIWETTSLKNVDFVLGRSDLEEFSPIKFYLLRDGEVLYGHFETVRQPATREASRGKDTIYIESYDVADLVVPPPEAMDVQQSTEAYDVATAPDFEPLIESLTSTVAPETWDVVGGPGTAAPFEANLSLVIRQTEKVHEEIADLLGQLRRMQGVPVILRTRSVEMAADSAEKLWPGSPEPKQPIGMDPTTTRRLLDRFRAESTDSCRVWNGPKVTVLNGQQAVLQMASFVKAAPVENTLSLQVSVDSRDRRKLWLTAQIGPVFHMGHREMTSEDTLAFEVVGTENKEEASRRTFVLVTPEVVFSKAEAKRLGVFKERSDLKWRVCCAQA